VNWEVALTPTLVHLLNMTPKKNKTIKSPEEEWLDHQMNLIIRNEQLTPKIIYDPKNIRNRHRRNTL